VFASWPAAADEPEPTALSSKIQQVTVFSDRAQVTREAAVRLPGSPATYVFRKLPGWVDEGSVRVALIPAEAGRIAEVRVRRDYLARSTDESYLKAQAAVQEIADQIAALDDELKILAAQHKQVEDVKVFAMDKVPKDAAVKDIKIETYGQVVGFVAQSLRDIATARRAIELKKRELLPELTSRQRKLQELQGMTQLEETSIYVTLEGGGGKSGHLKLTYMLPGATWEPAHELRVAGSNPDSAEIVSFAVVSQTCGEDWEGATLYFSTQSSTESNRIPQVSALLLGEGVSAVRIMQEQAASFSRAQAAFEGQNRMWNQYKAPQLLNNRMDVYDNNLDQLQLAQGRSAAVFEQLQQRGTTAHFEGEGKPTIRADGSPVRVRIGTTTLKAELAVVAVPEQSLNAVRTLKMVNVGTQPLLPGAVAIHHDAAFMGMTDMDFVAEGEEFAMFLGVADQIKLSRVLDRKKSSLDRKKRTIMRVAFVLTVENLSDKQVLLSLSDRIPISANQAIAVDEIQVTGDKKPDARGLLAWKLDMAPKEKKTIRFSYRVQYPPDLVQEMHRAVVEKRKAMPQAASPAAEEPDVSEQIMFLEDSLE
jgi:uncharacterized protein (TIGR02231 family)